AQGGERDDRQDQQGLTQLSELGVEQERHECEHEAKNQCEPALGALLVLELPRKFEPILGLVEVHRLRNLLFYLGQVGYQVTVGQIDANGQIASAVCTCDGAFAVPLREFRNLGERNLHAAR